jgi:AraC family transcriptional regulator
MEWIAAIHHAIAYIEQHLTEDINYEDVANHVHISCYEFHRAFSFLTGMTANAYIRNRRLSLAGRDILETHAKITDIALKYGYDTPESFTKAFTRFHGVAPSFARDRTVKLTLFNPIAIKISVEGGKIMDYCITQTRHQRFLTISRQFSNQIINDETNHDIPDFWQECEDQKLIDRLLSLRPDGKRDLYGLCTPTKEGEDTFTYGIGVLVDEETAGFDLSEQEHLGCHLWDVNPGTYVVFDCMGENGNCISQTWAKFYQEFLPQMGYETSEETDYELYPQKGKDGLFCELWVPIKRK